MNYLPLMLSAYLALSNAGPSLPPIGEDEWSAYLSAHNKVYTPEESALRRMIYAHTKQQVEEFNSRTQHDGRARLALNHMADWTEQERARLRGFRLPKRLLSSKLTDSDSRNTPAEQAFLNQILNDTSKPVPDELDWRKLGRVSDVKDQADCGSCWAFATVGLLEGQERKIVELSEQNLVDCDDTNDGCSGGYMKDALEYVAKVDGIESELDYPYKGLDDRCRFDKKKSAFTDAGGALLPIGDEKTLKKVVAKYGPVSVAIDASSIAFQFYQRGVFNPSKCANQPNQLDHAVLVVGYGTHPKLGDYWIVKNSWGKKWGEHGYILMARNRNNKCGIASMATIATF